MPVVTSLRFGPTRCGGFPSSGGVVWPTGVAMAVAAAQLTTASTSRSLLSRRLGQAARQPVTSLRTRALVKRALDHERRDDRGR